MPLKISVIKQSEHLCGVICNFLRLEGHQVACCSGCKEHPQHSITGPPDLIIIEVAMPELAAIETVNKLHRSAMTKRVPVIIISDFAPLELELLHVFDFICNPVDLGRLREDVKILEAGARKRDVSLGLPPLTNEEHKKFHDFLILHSGLHFERRNIKALERGLTSRMTALRISSYDYYFDYLCKNMEHRQELQKLLQHLTVGETFFFRYHAHFEVLRRCVLPQLVGAAQQKKLRIWSAGCSTGEEPYSIAMSIMESIPSWKKLDIKIIATDINSRSLSRAREGVYNDWKVRVTEKQYLEKYFKRIGESYLVRDEVKALVEFSYVNLQTLPLPADERFDIIFCRNVMIYFTTATTRKLVESFAVSLHKEGYLFLGHAETLAHISSKFERHLHDGGFYYRKKAVPAEKPAAIPAVSGAPVKAHRSPLQAASSLTAPAAAEQVIDPDALFAKGVSLLQRENFSEAAAIFDKLLLQRPDHAGAILRVGQIHLVSGRLDMAFECCNRALALDDLLAEGYFLRGLLYEMRERQSEAFEEYRKAILLQMNLVMPHYQLGKLCFRCGDHKSGLRELKNSLKLLEKSDRETVIPFSGGLSREVFIEQLRDEIQRVATIVAGESA